MITKLIFDTNAMDKQALVFVPGKSLQLGLRLHVRPETTKVIKGPCVFSANLRLGHNGLQGTNTLAYLSILSVMKKKG
jgi:hypothetical protein